MKNKIKQYILSIVESYLIEVRNEFSDNRKYCEKLESCINDNNESINQLKISIQQKNEYLLKLENDIRQNNAQVKVLEESIKKIDEFLNTIKCEVVKFPSYKENLRNINTTLAKSEIDYIALKKQMAIFEKAMIYFENKESNNDNRQSKSFGEYKDVNQDKKEIKDNKDNYNIIDYLDFENEFRGSTELISQRQKQYIPYFKEKKSILDIGCGRGEFLELMKEEGINAIGVDTYEDFISLCRIKGFEVVKADGLEYLKNCKLVDGIFLGQVVEHLKLNEIIELCNLAYQKLETGGCIIIETPNPKSLLTFANSFYIDPSHEKPVHPYSLRYYLKKAGFNDIKIIYTEESKEASIVPLLDSSASNIDDFNASLKRVSDVLFGSQDYAIIAIK